MDSLSQFALGAACGVAVMGRRTAVWKAALWGGVCGTLPDLDAFIDHGDPVRNMTLHRGNSHALFWLTLASPLIAAGIARLHGEFALFKRWWLAVWLALVTHPLLDLMTVYGTQLGRPFTDFPYAVGSVFIIDPLYTVPLLVGLVGALVARGGRGLRWNAAGLVLSTAYIAWSVAAQQHVVRIASASLAEQGVQVERLLVTPTPFNTVLWRVVAISPDGYREGFRSLLDADRRIDFERHARREDLRTALAGVWAVERMAWFTQGFYAMSERGDEVRLTDLRMGQEPVYSFVFVVAEGRGARGFVPLGVTRQEGGRPEIGPALDWLWRRASGERVSWPGSVEQNRQVDEHR